jgi:hypothetical protein
MFSLSENRQKATGFRNSATRPRRFILGRISGTTTSRRAGGTRQGTAENDASLSRRPIARAPPPGSCRSASAGPALAAHRPSPKTRVMSEPAPSTSGSRTQEAGNDDQLGVHRKEAPGVEATGQRGPPHNGRPSGRHEDGARADAVAGRKKGRSVNGRPPSGIKPREGGPIQRRARGRHDGRPRPSPAPRSPCPDGRQTESERGAKASCLRASRDQDPRRVARPGRTGRLLGGLSRPVGAWLGTPRGPAADARWRSVPLGSRRF